jgi:polyisoprenoid-binding protein YceI
MSSLPPKEILKMRYRLSSFAPALMALTFALAASADSYDVVGKPDIGFTATGPGGLKINGTADELIAIEQGDKLVFKASLKNVKTGIGLRDTHTKKYLATAQWPDASLTVDKADIKMPEDGKKSSGTVPAKFRLHGVTRDVKVQYSAERAGSGYAVTGNFGVNITDHKIEQPCYLGVCCDKNVKVHAKFKLKSK